MSVHAVFVPARIAPDTPLAVEAAVVVRERFSAAAFLFPFVWLLYRRAWWEFLGYALVMIAAALVAKYALGAGGGMVAALEILAGLFVGFSASDIHGRALERRGLVLADVVVAPDEDAALSRFAERRMAGIPAERPRTPRADITAAAAAPSRAWPAEGSGVLGSFPEAGR